MKKINFISLIAVIFTVFAFTNVAATKNPTMFNPNADNFKNKIVVAKTFATWCRYCRQGAQKDAELKESNQLSNDSNDEIVKVILVPEDDYENSVKFFEQLDLDVDIQIISEKQMSNWKVNYFPSILIFRNGKLAKMFEGEVEKSKVEKELINF